MDKGQPWFLLIVPVVGAITGILMAAVAYFSLREKYGERNMGVYRETVAVRVAGLEREVTFIKAQLEELKKDHEECLAQVASLTAEKYNLMQRLFQRPPS